MSNTTAAITAAAKRAWERYRSRVRHPRRRDYLDGYIDGSAARNAPLIGRIPEPPTLSTMRLQQQGTSAMEIVGEWHRDAGHSGAFHWCDQQPCHALNHRFA